MEFRRVLFRSRAVLCPDGPPDRLRVLLDQAVRRGREPPAPGLLTHRGPARAGKRGKGPRPGRSGGVSAPRRTGVVSTPRSLSASRSFRFRKTAPAFFSQLTQFLRPV